MPTDRGLNARKVQLIIDQVDSLPTLPAVATRVLALASSEDASARDLTRIIEADQALTSRILALVNSAAFNPGRPVASVDRAVSLLGFEAVRNSVLSLKVFDLFSRRAAASFHSAFDRKGFWKHCLAVAVAAQGIARRVRGVDPGEAFVAGLVHDIGKVALDYALPKTFDQVIRRVQAQRLSFAEAETGILGLDHAAVGKRLARTWRFPEPLVNVIWLHHLAAEHLPGDVEGHRLIEVVHLADIFARRQRIGVSSPLLDARAATETAEAMGLTPDVLDVVGKDLHQVVAEQVQVMGLEKADQKELFYESLASANADLGHINQDLMAARRQLEHQRRHAACLAAMGRDIHRARTAGQLLAVVAGAVRDWLGTDVCAAYYHGADGDYVEGILVRRGDDRRETFLFEDAGVDVSGVAPGLDRRQVGLARAEQSEGWLFERLGDAMGRGDFYCYALWSDDETVGGVVFAWPDDRSPPTQRDAREVDALATTAGLALGQWRQRQRLEQLSQSLAEANRKAADAQQELLKRRNLASIGVMAAGAAHEINNPLAVISGRAQILAEGEPDKKKRKSLDIITEQAERASAIVNELMAFARPPEPVLRMTDLGPILARVAERCRDRAAEADVRFSADLPAGPTPVNIDGGQVEWAVDQLLDNALNATSAGGTISLGLDHDPEAGLLVLSVTDTGEGMDGETLAAACDPFFSGRKAGRGRGLGLAKAQRVAEANNASLYLESAVAQGTTARLVFSTAESPMADPPPEDVE